jgi:hypothetical protein
MTGLYLATKGTNVDGTTTAVTGGTTYTTNTNNLSSISKSLSAIEGTGFNPNNDNLYTISTNIGNYSSTFGLNTGLYQQTASIQGNGFNTDTDSLYAISNTVGTPTAGATTVTLSQLIGNPGDSSSLVALLTTVIGLLTTDPIVSVTFAANNGALTTPVTVPSGNPSEGDVTTYNAAISAALVSTATATTFATQYLDNTNTAISDLSDAIVAFNNLVDDWGSSSATPIDSDYSAAQISAALNQLYNSLVNLRNAQTVA